MTWVRFVASGAEQKLGGKAEAMPHELVLRRGEKPCAVFRSERLGIQPVFLEELTEIATLFAGSASGLGHISPMLRHQPRQIFFVKRFHGGALHRLVGA